MSLVDSAAHCLVITAVQTTKSRFYLCTKKKKKTENKTENKNVTHILLLWNDSSRGSLLPHAQWVRVAAVGGCPIQRMFINTDLTSNCVRFQHETADLVRPVTVSGVHACEAAVRCRAGAGHGARGARLLLERRRQQTPQTREVVSPLIHNAWLEVRERERNESSETATVEWQKRIR